MRHLLRILPKNKKGFTLIEVLIASVILVIVMGSMTLVFIEANRAWTQSEAKLQVYQNAREALSRMTRELACAYQSSSSTTLEKFNWDDSQKKLAFTAAFNVVYDTDEYDLTKLGYWLDTTTMTLKRYKKDYGGGGGGTWNPIAENIKTLAFKYYDHKLDIWVSVWDPAGATPRDYLPRAVEITITAEDKQGRFTRTFVDTVYIPMS
ncbi:MAG: prepilin-type N-terminal cleavage/methylation domain-containing protein [Candidatus Omnitrophica bacterium]|nr:prepilin-type N-terminal cleavage/methylation domain-containing protein [Candidatus Omnitrophota bacterium]